MVPKTIKASKKSGKVSIQWRVFNPFWFIFGAGGVLASVCFMMVHEPHPYKAMWIYYYAIEQYIAFFCLLFFAYKFIESFSTSSSLTIGTKYLTQSYTILGISTSKKVVRMNAVTKFYANKSPTIKGFNYHVFSIMNGGIVTEIARTRDARASKYIITRAKGSLKEYRDKKSRARAKARAKSRDRRQAD